MLYDLRVLACFLLLLPERLQLNTTLTIDQCLIALFSLPSNLKVHGIVTFFDPETISRTMKADGKHLNYLLSRLKIVR